ncbi:DEAD/DEAH box helicase [Candidatus Cyanaurora vandensis]|uniref:DEAD/DEAH box helicase n=1 Tax=Candidatus Cyanaurora vandensis TaxID=2714958 RepID=UPI00257A8DC9|nr:DEAD/DEAH box helicase family protein [Candidatus Cyanaurora vandensis]
MAAGRLPTLTYDRGTLLLHPPPRSKTWLDFATWDDRVEKFRVPAQDYWALVECLRQDGVQFRDEARKYEDLTFGPLPNAYPPYPHQQAALSAWQQGGRRGVVVLPTAAGKTYLALLALQSTPRSTLIVVPTLDLMHQWYAQLADWYPQVGLLGGGSQDRTPLLVATYDSAAIHSESLGNCYGLLIFDECHHLPGDFYRGIAETAIAPFRLGLSATPERTDGKHQDLAVLIGPEVYRQQAQDLAGIALAHHQVVPMRVELSAPERVRYDQCLQVRDQFLARLNIRLGGLEGWRSFVQASARSRAGRQAMLAHQEARQLALGTPSKLRVLEELIQRHHPERMLIFTQDNQTVYQISRQFLIPAITHQTPVKERHRILQHFREGTYPVLVVARVLDEGVDVPAARIAVWLAGSGSTRQFVQRLGRILRRGDTPDKQAILYEVITSDTVEEGTARRRHQGPDATLRAADPAAPWGPTASPSAEPRPRAPESGDGTLGLF